MIVLHEPALVDLRQDHADLGIDDLLFLVEESLEAPFRPVGHRFSLKGKGNGICGAGSMIAIPPGVKILYRGGRRADFDREMSVIVVRGYRVYDHANQLICPFLLLGSDTGI